MLFVEIPSLFLVEIAIPSQKGKIKPSCRNPRSFIARITKNAVSVSLHYYIKSEGFRCFGCVICSWSIFCFVFLLRTFIQPFSLTSSCPKPEYKELPILLVGLPTKKCVLWDSSWCSFQPFLQDTVHGERFLLLRKLIWSYRVLPMAIYHRKQMKKIISERYICLISSFACYCNLLLSFLFGSKTNIKLFMFWISDDAEWLLGTPWHGQREIPVEESQQDERRESNKQLILSSCFLCFNQPM